MIQSHFYALAFKMMTISIKDIVDDEKMDYIAVRRNRRWWFVSSFRN